MLKAHCFERDGWREDEQSQFNTSWRAMCAFGCGEILVWKTATLDRFPLMGKDGGRYLPENVRLACRDCNSMCRNKNDPTVKTRKKRFSDKRYRKERQRMMRKVIQNLDVEGKSVHGIVKMDLK